MHKGIKKSSVQWAEELNIHGISDKTKWEDCNIIVLDPDGWDRTSGGWKKSIKEKITREDFNTRLLVSTLRGCIKKGG